VSRAFVKEEAADLPPLAPPRAALPSGVPNYVTERGLALLHSELDALTLERTRVESALERADRGQAAAILAQRRAQLEERIASAIVVVPKAPADEVRFGTSVTLLAEDGVERTFQLVGVDEAEPAQGRIAFVSPVARALLGRRAGDVATVRTPRGEETLEVISVTS
jgi:transcription elongation factor GreB